MARFLLTWIAVESIFSMTVAFPCQTSKMHALVTRFEMNLLVYLHIITVTRIYTGLAEAKPNSSLCSNIELRESYSDLSVRCVNLFQYIKNQMNLLH